MNIIELEIPGEPQVARLVVEKAYSDRPRVEIEAREG
jgi:Holliday junction resolvase RusA-like endonuclease